MTSNSFRTLQLAGRSVRYVALAAHDVAVPKNLPVTLRILAENVLRGAVAERRDAELRVLYSRQRDAAFSFRPARVLLHDLLGIPALADLAALREAVAANGGDPSSVNPRIPVTLIIDHSLRVDIAGVANAPARNLALEHERNIERFTFLRWCQTAFRNVKIVPPGKGIMHQINLEKISRVIWSDEDGAEPLVFPDTLIGTDSHTPMVNGICVLGWGVGGIEAEAAMLGHSLSIALPKVIGVEVSNSLPVGTTPTDLVLSVTQRLRAHGVVGQFIEFFGAGLDALSVPDRATISNMAPEFGATNVLFPIDRHTMAYLKLSGREAEQVELVEAYARAQELWRDETTPASDFDEVIKLDLSSIRPCIAGPRRPEDRIDLADAATAFKLHVAKESPRADAAPVAGANYALPEGAIVIAAITSCTNTSNPAGMATAGLVARKAARRGLKPKPWVKTSLAPGSQAIAAFLQAAGLQSDLDALGFNVIGFGCTTCNGMSGPLAAPIADAIETNGLVATAVLSGNRNFEGRIHPNVRAAYLASPALVVAYALAGVMNVDLTREAIGQDRDGKPVLLADLWPTPAEINAAVDSGMGKTDFATVYSTIYDGDDRWQALAGDAAATYAWDNQSTYIRRPPYFDGVAPKPAVAADMIGMRPLAILGDSITTDHITPSGAISKGSVAAKWLEAHGVGFADFNSYGTRRGNFELVSRATFANIRVRNAMVPGQEGSFTKLMPSGTVMPIYDAAVEYQRRGVGLIVIAGKDYGCGSSRDTAAKGPKLLGIKAVVAESFERIHRSNLVGMGILPLQLPAGVRADTLGLDGSETFDIISLASGITPRKLVSLRINSSRGTQTLDVTLRADTPEEAEMILHGGILPAVYREFVS
jgi:aconitate hydratase